MDHERVEDSKLAQALSSGSFSPASDDMAFLGAVRHGVKVRRRRQTVRNSALASLTVVLLVVAVFQPWNGSQQQFGPLLTSAESLAAIGFSDDELLELTDNYDELFSLTDDHELAQELSSELETLFDVGDVADPVAYLAGYDEEVQDQVLEQLKSMSIFDNPGQIQFSAKGEI
ncbi:hypothetical protein KQI52_14740 [bacterium]|nr:hypothetical protein [bacterium]